jgi:hypothetical protein
MESELLVWDDETFLKKFERKKLIFKSLLHKKKEKKRKYINVFKRYF